MGRFSQSPPSSRNKNVNEWNAEGFVVFLTRDFSFIGELESNEVGAWDVALSGVKLGEFFRFGDLIVVKDGDLFRIDWGGRRI